MSGRIIEGENGAGWGRFIHLRVVGALLLCCCLGGLLLPAATLAGEPVKAAGEAGNDHDPWADDPWGDDPWGEEWGAKSLADPLQPLNRVFFTFNDRLYVWALEPAARGYAKVLPEDIRFCVRRFFNNLLAPVRAVNHLLQGRVKDSGTELARFAINTTVGIGGLVDSAADNFGIKQRHADLGQTLGVYGFGGGFYIHWPFLGPSTLRDSIGMAGDAMVNPTYRYLADDPESLAALHGARTVNTVSLHPGEYERMVGAAFDPYIAVREAYWQYRQGVIQGRGREGERPAVFSDDDSLQRVTLGVESGE